jgi:ketosteroid isomerase-like protein
MKKLCMILPLVFLLCFTFGCQQAEEVAKVDFAAEEQAIRDILQKTVEAKNQRNWDEVIKMYAETAVKMPYNEPERDYTLEDMREYYVESHEGIDSVEAGLKRIVISEAGDMAWSTGWNRNFRTDGVIIEMKWFAIWHKINDEWKCVGIGGNHTSRTRPEEKK